MSKSLIQCTKSFDLSSDRSPVFIHSYKSLLSVPPKCFLSNRKRSNFKTTLNTNLKDNVPLNTEDDIMDAVELFTKNVQDAAWSSTPENVQPKSHSVNNY